ncbi:MAG: carboxylesterase family protein [Deltaproteobacteria bacterium]|nr:carboxylesterase family protein [Deltaproteobacteria bacterium]MBW2359503.1 carboxylesterase family protein [Deltaproteobacteria bacterium]
MNSTRTHETASILFAALAASWLALGCGEATPGPSPETELTIAQGTLVGSTSEADDVHAWRGIPFARPPVGELRWRAARRPDAWEGTLEALASGSECLQAGGDPVLGSEDCLYLDVFAPTDALARSELLPVMFWIHGGGNTMGAGNQLDPSRLVAENRVVVVTINYRLGVLGWFSHPALRARAESRMDASGNFGTLDMIRALEWVHENIASFGGNPGRVTIFGESAGGIDVFSLLLSPVARGLFHSAVAQSGVPSSMTRNQAEAFTDAEDPGLGGSSSELLVALLQQAGEAEDRDGAKRLAANMSEKAIVRFLRGQSGEEILAPFVASIGDRTMPIYISPTVIRDGTVIPNREPLDAFATPGAYNAVPVIAGTNREESKLFFALTSPHVSRTFGIPTHITDERLYDIEGEYGGLVWRAQGADEPIAAMHRVQGDSVWAYRFDWDEEPTLLGLDLSELLGAAHGLELPFVFGLTDLGFAGRLLFEDLESAAELSRQMRSYWSNFAYTLAPGRGRDGDLPEWKPWSPKAGAPKYLSFDSARDTALSTGNDVIRTADVLARAVADPRLRNDEERCRVFRNMVQWSMALTPDEYTQINDGACRKYPLEARVDFASLPE